jgi:hypothetical protein
MMIDGNFYQHVFDGQPFPLRESLAQCARLDAIFSNYVEFAAQSQHFSVSRGVSVTFSSVLLFLLLTFLAPSSAAFSAASCVGFNVPIRFYIESEGRRG